MSVGVRKVTVQSVRNSSGQTVKREQILVRWAGRARHLHHCPQGRQPENRGRTIGPRPDTLSVLKNIEFQRKPRKFKPVPTRHIHWHGSHPLIYYDFVVGIMTKGFLIPK